VLANIVELVLRRIPIDPTLPRYRQGDTLGKNYKHWFREKFSSGRFRLFFRYDLASKIIVYAWVNDSKTLPPCVIAGLDTPQRIEKTIEDESE
jgi:toxin YhaV